jgi:hypothetical protein
MTNASAEAFESRVEPVGRADWRRFALFLGAAAVAILAVAGGVVILGDRLPPLTDESLEEAVHRWEESGVRSYVMDLEITGQRAGNVHVEVVNGVVTDATRNLRPLGESRMREAWSVPGQFDTLRRGLEIASDPAGELQLKRGTQVVVRARFDPELGYPRAFSQATLGGGTEFGWKTVRFERR